MKFQEKREIFGSPKKEYNPQIASNGVWHCDFSELELYFPLDFILMTNRTLDDIKYYLDGEEATIYSTENQKETTKKFRRLTIVAGSNGVSEGELRIIVQKQPMSQDIKARNDYLESRKPLAKLKRLISL